MTKYAAIIAFALTGSVFFVSTAVNEFYLYPKFWCLSLALLIFTLCFQFKEKKSAIGFPSELKPFALLMLISLRISCFISPVGNRIYASALLLMWLVWFFYLSVIIQNYGIERFVKAFVLLQLPLSLIAYLVLLYNEVYVKSYVHPFFGNPNIAGNFVALSGFQFLIARKYFRDKCFRYFCISTLILAFYLLVSLQARAALLGLMAAISYYVYRQRTRFSISALNCTVGVTFFSASVIFVLFLILSKGVQSMKIRLSYWKSAFFLILDHPFGVGLGAFEYVFEKYDQLYSLISERGVGAYLQNPHNMFLEFTAELGILFIFGFLTLLFLIVRKLIHIKSLEVTWVMSCAVLILIISIFEFPHETPFSYFYMSVCMAVAIALLPTMKFPLNNRFKALGSGLGILVFLFFSYKNYYSYKFREKRRDLSNLEKVCHYDPENIVACSAYTSALIHHNKHLDARNEIFRLKDRYGDYSLIYFLRGSLNLAQGNKSAACENFKKYADRYNKKGHPLKIYSEICGSGL